MTYATLTPNDVSLYDPDLSWRRVSSQTLLGAVALACSLSAGAWFLDARHVLAPKVDAAAAVASAAPDLDQAPRAAPAAAKLAEAPAVPPAAPKLDAVLAAVSDIVVAAKTDGALLDPAFSLGVAPGSFAETATLGRDFAPTPSALSATLAQRNDTAPAPPGAVAQLHDAAPAPPEAVAEPGSIASVPLPIPAASQAAEAVPLPAPRPMEFRLQANRGPFRTFGRRVAQLNRPAAIPAAPADNRNFIEKLFGMPQQPPGPALAYATPEDGLFGRSRPTTSGPALPYDRWTAVYDISAHTVYMPNGARLEAHSGLGNRLDDPRSVTQRDRGATPPNVYELEPRAQLFHGVQALRLNPVGAGGTFGRNGFLAHTYMLGPHGDSNGCVSFKDYNAFLQAYQNGEIKRLAVVARLI